MLLSEGPGLESYSKCVIHTEQRKDERRKVLGVKSIEMQENATSRTTSFFDGPVAYV